MSAGSGVGRGRGSPTVSGFQPALDRLVDRVNAQGRTTERQERQGAAAAGSDDEGVWDPEEGDDGADMPGGAGERQENLRGFGGGVEVGDDGEELWDREEGSDEDTEGVIEEESEDEAPASADPASAEADAKVRAAAEVRPGHVLRVWCDIGYGGVK